MSITPAKFNTPHFRWKDPFVTIRITDSESPQPPTSPTETSVSLMPGDPKWNQNDLMWRQKLGALIVHDYLAINPGGYKSGKKYFLSRFPRNYVFYVRKTTNPKTLKVRHDSYLNGGGHTFRSPNEFVFHAAWLMAGAVAGQCSCVYCDSDNPGQRGRSRSIEENRILVRQRIRRFKAAGVKIERGLNAMNRKAFLKRFPAKGNRRVSFEVDDDAEEEVDELDEETPADSNSSASTSTRGDRVVKLVHGYDEESDQDTQQ